MTLEEQNILRAKFEKWYAEDYFSNLATIGPWDPIRNLYVEFEDHIMWCGFRGHAMLKEKT